MNVLGDWSSVLADARYNTNKCYSSPSQCQKFANRIMSPTRRHPQISPRSHPPLSPTLSRTTTRPRPVPPPNPPEPPLTLLHPSQSLPTSPDELRRSYQDFNRTGTKRSWVWSIGRGMRRDVVSRLPWYWSDWVDAWNYRVIPSTWVRMIHASP